MGSSNRSFKSSANMVYSCKYHIVWCPKYRRKVLVDLVAIRLEEIIRNTTADKQVEIIEMEIMPDHVHLLCEVHPQYGVHVYVRLLKGRSSRLMRQEFISLRSRLPTKWTNSYSISTVGGAPLEIVKQYIEN
jgi:putative transposase